MVKGLLLVAHPDDETFFAASTLLHTKHIVWDIVCLTHSVEEGRGQKMAEALAVLHDEGAVFDRAYMLGMGDPTDNPVPPTWWYQRARNALHAKVVVEDYMIVLTHNRSGEYGHPHHLTANAVARYSHSNVWEFYHDLPSGIGPQWRGVDRKIFAHPGKDRALAVYSEELDAFCAHYPTLGALICSREEQVTGNGRWPYQ